MSKWPKFIEAAAKCKRCDGVLWIKQGIDGLSSIACPSCHGTGKVVPD